MQVHPFVWFESGAEEAAKYYEENIPNTTIHATTNYPEAAEEVSGQKPGSVMTVELTIAGSPFSFLNGGKVPGFEMNSDVSFVITCDTQEEIDNLWDKLSAVPEAEQCGWCKDKFGLTWQIVPNALGELLSSGDHAQTERVTAAFLKMKKFNIAELESAAKGE